MSKVLIAGNPTFKKDIPTNDIFIDVAEFFCDTIQGEGINIGAPAAFFRVQGCTQACIWCDTQEVWRFGNPYTITEIFKIMEDADLIRKFREGQHLIFTGGSPLRQQKKLISLVKSFIKTYGFKPYIEIENESVLVPFDEMIEFIDCWNNSPKLENSFNAKDFRFQPTVLKQLSSLPNSWFKFVVTGDTEWAEIEEDFLKTGFIRKDQIILMPLGATQEELFPNREKVIEIAVRENVRYCTREHIVLWNKKTGV